MDGPGIVRAMPSNSAATSGVRPLRADELEPLATGAWILGAGGGGDPYHAFLNLRRMYEEGTVVSLMDPDALADDALVAVVSTMGAPLVGEERLTDPTIAALAVRQMEEHLGRRFDAVMSLEIGGSNSFQPLMVAAVTGLPVLDADTMGRAYPEAQHSSFAIGDLQPYPLTLADVRENAIVVSKVASWKWMERISRKVCTEVGSLAATCKAPRTGREVKEWGVLRTVTQAIRLGETVLDARRRKADPVAAVVEHGGGLLLFSGKVVDNVCGTVNASVRKSQEAVTALRSLMLDRMRAVGDHLQSGIEALRAGSRPLREGVAAGCVCATMMCA